MAFSDQLIKDSEIALGGVVSKFKQDLGQVRSNRPSTDMIQDIRIALYGQSLTIRELGSLAVVPPRTIQITVWDKDAVAPVTQAIEGAHLGLSVSNDGMTIRATLSQLGNERREEMMKLVKKMTEAARIQIRGAREQAMKRLKDSEVKKEISEDEAFKAKDKIQKAVDKVNKEAEAFMDAKIKELSE